MAKRIAELQINKDGLAASSDDEKPSGISVATADVMAKRKILKPKGKSFTFATAPAPAPTTLTFPQFSLQPTATKASDVKTDKLKALANKFAEAVNKANTAESVPDLRAACEKYLEFYKKLDGEVTEATSIPAFGSVASLNASLTGATNPNSFGKDNTTTDAAKPQENPSSFLGTTTFGGLFSQKGSKSTPETQPQVPVAKNPFANVAFGKLTSKPEQSKETGLGSVSQAISVDASSDESEDEKPKEIKIAGPTFNLTNKPTIKNSPFSFGKKPEPKVVDSDSESEVEIKGPTFVFNKKILDPVFSLNKANDKQNIPEPAASKTDSKPASEGFKTSAAPTFSFGQPQSSESIKSATVPSFNFGQPQKSESNKNLTDTVTAKSPAFLFTGNSFASSTGSNVEASKPATFNFGAVKAPSSEGSGFLFGSASKDASKPSSFGASSLFGNLQTTEAKPTFSFGSGSSSIGSKPTPFLFGSQVSSNGDKKENVKDASKSLFGMSSGSTQDSTENKEAENEAENEPDVNFAPVASLGDKKVEVTLGEENETTVLQLRAKLMTFDPNNKEDPYKSMGVGELKILKSKETNKSRILIRADGALRVLLNTSVVKELKYETMGNGSLARVPSIEADGQIKTYVVKVKTAEDGQNLVKALNDVKNDGA